MASISLGDIFYSLGIDVRGMQRAQSAVRNFATGVRSAGGANKEFVDQLRALESASVLAVGPLSGLGARIRAMSAIMERSTFTFAAFTAGVVAAGYGLFKLGQESIKVNLALLGTRQRLTLLTGSAAIASDEFDWLRKVSDKAGTDIISTADSYSKFLASLQGTSLEGSKAREIFDKLNISGANLVLTTSDMEGVFRALQQMMSKGTVQAEELRNQLGDRLYGAFRIAAQAMGATTSQLNIMLKKGQVLSEDFVPKFVDALVKAMGIDATKAVDNLQASTNRLYNAWVFFIDELDRSLGISSAYKTSLEGLTAAIEGLSGNFEKFVPWIAAVAGALLGLAAPSILVGLYAVVSAIWAMAAAMIGLSAASVPVFGVIGVLTRLALAAGGATLAYNLMQDSFQRNTGIDRSINDLQEYVNATDNVKHALVDVTKEKIKSATAAVAAAEAEIQALEAKLWAEQAYVDSFSADSPKILAWLNYLIPGFDELREATGAAGQSDALEQRLTTMKEKADSLRSVLDALVQLLKEQEAAPAIEGGRGGTTQTDAQMRRLEKVTAQFQKLKEEVDATKQGVSALAAFKDKWAVEDAALSFKQSLEQTGMAQDEVNAKVEEFRRLMQEKINLQPNVEAVKELQQVVISGFGSVADSIAEAMVEGGKSIEDFAEVGKRFLEQLISKFIELAIFNQLLNGVFGLSGSSALPTIGPGMFAMHAQGGIINGPTVLGYNRGKYDVGGEKGPEAVMPLYRSSGGALGVKTLVGAQTPTQVAVHVNVIEGQGTKTEVKQRQDGGLDIRTMVDEMSAGLAVQQGTKLNRSLRTMGNKPPLKRL